MRGMSRLRLIAALVGENMKARFVPRMKRRDICCIPMARVTKLVFLSPRSKSPRETDCNAAPRAAKGSEPDVGIGDGRLI